MNRGIRKTLIKERGITLVALVITIVILIILAAVSINVIIEGGLIERAKNSSEGYEEEQAREKLELELADLGTAKIVEKEKYNENEYIDTALTNKE